MQIILNLIPGILKYVPLKLTAGINIYNKGFSAIDYSSATIIAIFLTLVWIILGGLIINIKDLIRYNY